MKIKRSPLQIQSFEVLECTFKVIAPSEMADVDHNVYSVDLDFEILEGRNNDIEAHFLPVVFKINDEKNALPGYQIKVNAIGSFSIENEKDLEEQDIHNLKVFSSVNIMISNVRGYLRDITAYGPFGSYQMPSIDMSDLLLNKQRDINQNGKNKKKPRGKS